MNKCIVFITSSFPFGKSEVWAINELNSLIKLGNEIIIIPRTGKGKIINQDANKFKSKVIDLPFFNCAILLNLVNSIIFKPYILFTFIISNINQSNTVIDFIKGFIILPKSLYISNILIGKKIDHIHTLQTTSTAYMAYILSKILKKPWSYTLHTSEILNAQFKRSIFFQSQSASLCRTISRSTANDLSNFLGSPLSSKVCMVHLGVDIAVNRHESYSNKDSYTIVTPAELTNRKGHIYAIKAAQNLIKIGITNFKWYFYGSGPLLNELLKNLKELNLTKHCFFPGNLDHQKLLDLYKNNEVDIVVISSISTDVPEGIPVSLMEAMVYKIPVISTDCGGTKELVNGESGILVNQHDPEAISKAILSIINDQKLKNKIGENGRNKITLDFDTMKNARKLIELF